MCDFSKVIISREQLDKRISEIARDVSGCYANVADKDKIAFIWLLEGARKFAESLVAKIDFKVEVYSIRASSYKDLHVSSGKVEISGELPDLRGKRVLLIDDILDTGLTAKTLIAELKSRGASEVKTCFLLNKISKNRGSVKPDFQGFEIPDEYVVGFGMDSAGLYRELPYICVLQ